MEFRPLSIEGAFLVVPRPHGDDRGFFARAWCRDEFRLRGLMTDIAQCNMAHNRRRGTLRGMHFQRQPGGESKLVRCTRGAMYDVIVDLRPAKVSGRPWRWESVELTADNRHMLYVPSHVAHGYQTLVDDTEVFYQVSSSHRPDLEGGFRWDDPAVGIRWPLTPSCLSSRDLDWPSLDRRPPDEQSLDHAPTEDAHAFRGSGHRDESPEGRVSVK